MASHDNGNVTEYGTRPKSILKLRDGSTVPIAPLHSNGRNKYDRRVSFAEKVKLHQIELVHVLQPTWPELDSEDDPSDEDTSFLQLEADADKIVSALGLLMVPELSSSDEDEDNDEEETMELTGQTKDVAYTTENPADNASTANVEIPVSEPIDDIEQDMELTETIKPVEIDSSTNHLDGELNAAVSNNTQPNETTLDLTLLQTDNVDGNTEVSMDMTKQFGETKVRSSSPIQIPVLEPLTDDEGSDDVPMELTQQLTDNQEKLEHDKVKEDVELAAENELQNGAKENKEEDENEDSQGHEQEEQVNEFGEHEIEQEQGSEEECEQEHQQELGHEELQHGNEQEQNQHVHGHEEHDHDREHVHYDEKEAENETVKQSDETEEVEMELTQSLTLKTESIPDNQKDHKPQGLKRPLNGSSLLPKKIHSEYITSTTTIPLADVSMGSDDMNFDIPNVSLTDFLADIGIKFYDDLQFSTDMSNRYRFSLSDTHGSVSLEDYFRANVQLPILEVYELCCKELSGKIQQGMQLFNELKAETLQNNPDIFRTYYRASFYDQMTMKARFHTLKEYTRQQAKQIWYQWRSKLIENLLGALKSNLEILQTDKAVLVEQQAALDSIFRDIQQKIHKVRLEVLAFKDIQTRFQNLDVEQIQSIKSKLTRLNLQLIDHKSKILNNEEQLRSLQAQIALRNDEISILKLQIAVSDNKLNQTRHFNSTEISGLDLESKVIQAGAGLKFVKVVRDQVYEFQFNPRIKVVVDFLSPDDARGITFLFLNDDQVEVLYNEHLLLAYCQRLVEQTGFTNIFDTFISFRRKWLKLTEIDRDIYQLSVRYPIHFDGGADAIAFTFSYYSFENKGKAQCRVQIPLDSILEYPNNVTFGVLLQRFTGLADVRHAIGGSYHLFRSIAVTTQNT